MSDDGIIIFDLQPGSYEVKLLCQWTNAFNIGVILIILSIAAWILSRFKTKIQTS